MKDLEEQFSEFIDGNTYDQAQQALFDIIRTAYVAGYQAALNKDRDNVVKLPIE